MFASRSVIGVFAVVAALATGAAACSSPTTATAPPSTASLTSAQLASPSAKRATQVTPILLEHRSEGAGPSGALVVSAEIVRRCDNLQALKGAARPADEEKLWLSVLQSLSDCMNTAPQRTERLVVTGGSRPAALVRYMLAKVGIDRERVDALETVAADDDCAFDDECTSFAVRIDLASSASRTAQL